MLVIGDPHDVWILANIKESYIRDVVVGKAVDIQVDAYPDHEFRGIVDTIGHAAISEFALFPPPAASPRWSNASPSRSPSPTPTASSSPA